MEDQRQGRAPTVSVVIPVFNGARYLRQAIDSVLAQSYGDMELIVVDSGSTDDTPAILREYPSVRWLTLARNEGPAKARNYGVHHARGGYVAFLDHDDLWYPQKLALQVSVLKEDLSVGVIYTDQEWVDMDGRTLQRVECSNWPKGYEKIFYGGHNVGPSTMMVRKGLLEQVGLFDEELWFLEDKDLLIRLFDVCTFRRVGEVLIKKRLQQRHFSVRHQLEQMVLDSHHRFLLKLSRRPLTAEQRRLIEQEWSVYYSDLGKHWMRRGKRALAIRNFAESLRRDPFRAKTYGRMLRCLVGLS